MVVKEVSIIFGANIKEQFVTKQVLDVLSLSLIILVGAW